MKPTLLVLHGPNLNLLGQREPEIYGRTTLAEINTGLQQRAEAAGLAFEALQSNAEHLLIERVQAAMSDRTAFIIINPAAFTHTSVALLGALKTLSVPVVECHLSNPAAREAFRHHSYVSLAATGVIAGFGPRSYELAVRAALDLARRAGAKG